MKKIFLLIAYCFLFLVGCQTEETTLSILVPNGIPSIAQSQLEYDDNVYDVERVSGAQPLSAAFLNNTHDIIIAPINLGANLYQKGATYQLAGVLTWSNLQIISRTPIQSLSDLEGQEIIAFGQGAIPEIILTYLFEQADLANSTTINYDATSVQESLLTFMQGADYAVVSEPVTSQVLSLDETVYIFDLANPWSTTTGLSDFPQAGVFVSQSLQNKQINDYLSDLEDATNKAIDNPEEIAALCSLMDYPFEESLITISLPKSHIDFQTSTIAKDAIDDMLNLIYNENKALIGNNLPDEGWLYLDS